MSNAVVTIQIANTPSGEYDPHQPLPKPYHCDAGGKVVRGADEGHQVIGFAADPDEFTVDITWFDWYADPSDRDGVVGMFAVVADDADDFATLTLPVSEVKTW